MQDVPIDVVSRISGLDCQFVLTSLLTCPLDPRFVNTKACLVSGRLVLGPSCQVR